MCLRRKDAIYYPDMWELPGGGVKPHQTPRETAVRECWEELQISIPVEHCTLLNIYHGQDGDRATELHVFYAFHPEDISPVFGEGQQAWRWMTANDIWNYDHIPANKQILQDLLSLDTKVSCPT